VASVHLTADLDVALRFVIGRIEGEAARLGEPLSDEERFLLNNLPKSSELPLTPAAFEEWPALVTPRDTLYERLCGLAKAARDTDLRLNPSACDWEFAAAVLRLDRHPMSWFLQWAGVKEHRPWWDRWLLVAGAMLLILVIAALMLLAGNEPWSRFQWTGIGAAYIGVLVLLHFVSRWIEARQLKQTIERCRRFPLA
jgi:hypothetical protein